MISPVQWPVQPSSKGFLEKQVLFSSSHGGCLWIMEAAGAQVVAEVGHGAMDIEMGELTLGVIPLGTEVSPGVNFNHLHSWGCPRLVVLA